MSVVQYTQGHTPHDRLSYLISRICTELDVGDTSTSIPTEALALAKQAKAIIDGYDGYLQKMSSPHPPVVDVMITEGNKQDWDRLHREGKTMFKLIPEMTAGGYEAVVLQQLAKLAKACPFIEVIPIPTHSYHQARVVLEIGMFTGTTTVSLAMLPTVEKVVTLELEGYLESNNRPHFEQSGVSEKIDIRIGDALASLDQLIKEGASFDMVRLLLGLYSVYALLTLLRRYSLTQTKTTTSTTFIRSSTEAC